mmetsp:Transcript_13522/g.27627  ORF Transcript_13522/g.27627 Transcript_13522/m.27627 type:complete len:228 (+) Transcript_13522:179-862(+)
MPHLAHVASWATALNSASNRGSDSSDTPPPPSTRFFFLAAPPLPSLQLALPPLSLPVAGLCFGGLPTFFLLRTSPPWWPMSTPLLPFPPAPFPPDFPFLGPPPMLLSPSLKEPSSLSSPRSFASTAPEAEETAAAAAAAAATVAGIKIHFSCRRRCCCRCQLIRWAVPCKLRERGGGLALKWKWCVSRRRLQPNRHPWPRLPSRQTPPPPPRRHHHLRRRHRHRRVS